MDPNHTTQEWEQVVGEGIRALRLRQGIDQITIASRAGIAVNALRSLEAGGGSTLKTLVAVLRALDRAGWLTTLAPPVSISPLALIKRGKERKNGRKPALPER